MYSYLVKLDNYLDAVVLRLREIIEVSPSLTMGVGLGVGSGTNVPQNNEPPSSTISA